MRQPNIPPWLSGVLVFAVASLLFSAYFRGLMLSPNQRSPTFGGDGLTIHYNLQYHATYGDGVYLGAQYHPHEESVFMTDAQALVAVVLAELRPWFPGLHRYSAGISNALIFWSNPLAALLLFLLLRRVGVRWPLALIGGCLIAMMSPQILRQLGGQYTLGFTFLLPLLIYYQLAWDDGKNYLFRSFGVALVVVLIGLNNPYLYAVSVGLLLGAAGVGVLLRWFPATRLPWRQLLSWVGVSLVATGVIFLTLAYFDTVDDRVEVPFGFFKNIASWGGLLTEPESFAYPFVHGLLPGLKAPFRENRIYIGLVPLLFCLGGLVTALVPGWRKRLLGEVPKPLRVLVFGVLPGLVFAFGIPFIYVADWTYEHLGSILQFRAPARFGWPVFYLAGIVAVYGMQLVYDRLPGGKALLFLALPLVPWGVEAHQFLLGHLDDHIGPNAFTPSAIERQQGLAAGLGIDTSTYSSIYLLPTEQGWSDKVHHQGSWRSNHDGYKLSLATGLPLLNGKLSRVSLGWVLRSLQLVSDPLIPKPLLDELDPAKDILLLASAQDHLADPEAALLALADTLVSNERVVLARLSPTALHLRSRQTITAARHDTMATAPALRWAYDDNPAHAYHGPGSRYVAPGWTDLLSFATDTLPADTAGYRLSLWALADKSRFGGPKFYLRQLDAAGQRLQEDKVWINTTYDTHHGWLRANFRFRPVADAATIVLVGEYEFGYWLDEVWVWPRGGHARSEGLYDGVRLEETGE